MMRNRLVFLAMLLAAVLVAGCVVEIPTETAPLIPCSEATPHMEGDLPDLGGCELRVAVENAYQPFNFIDTETGEAIGFDYDVFAVVCERINCVTTFIETSWDAMVALMAGEGTFSTFDLGADGITITPERSEHVDFSIPYIVAEQVLLVVAEEERFYEPEEFAAMEDLVIGTQLGTTNYYASLDLVGEDRIVAYDQFGTAVQALINGDVDAVMIDNVAGQGYVGANADKLKTTGVAVQDEQLGFVLAKGSHLTPVINAALESMMEDGSLAELIAQWF